MKTFITHVDFYLSRLGGPPGVITIFIYTTQVKAYGFRHWCKWVTTGVMRGETEAMNLERKAEAKVEAVEREVSRDINAIEDEF